MYKCPTCGAGLVFDPKTQNLLCKSCRNTFNPEEVDNIKNMKLDQAKEVEGAIDARHNYEAISYKCSHCGAELITTDETITTFCSFCRTGTMVERKVIEKRKPDYVIPFSITKEECEDIYKSKIKHAFFAPKRMIDEQEVQKIRGIYMPYWIYSFEKHGRVFTTGHKYSHRSGNYEYYDDYSLETTIDASCRGISHDATSNFWDRLSESIAPYSVRKKKIFSPAYLSGFYADNEDVDDEVYHRESKYIANDEIDRRLLKEKEYRKFNARPRVSMDDGNIELALFPVYYLATKNKAGDRLSYAVINGQTGKIAADIPIDFKKILIFSLILAIPIFLLLNKLFTFNMWMIAAISIIFNIISIHILDRQNKKIEIREKELDDKGFQYKKNGTDGNLKTEMKIPSRLAINAVFVVIWLCPLLSMIFFVFRKYTTSIDIAISWILFIGGLIWAAIKIVKNRNKDKSIYKPIAGLMLTLIVFCISPAADAFYYAAALTSIGLTAMSFYDIVEKFNMLTTRKLPQLEKRGGDENA